MARKSKRNKGAGGVKLILLTTSLAATLGLWNYFSRQDNSTGLGNSNQVTLPVFSSYDSSQYDQSTATDEGNAQPLNATTNQPLVTDSKPEIVDDFNLSNVTSPRTKSSG